MERRWAACYDIVECRLLQSGLDVFDMEALKSHEPVHVLAALAERTAGPRSHAQIVQACESAGRANPLPECVIKFITFLYTDGFIIPPCGFIDLSALALLSRRVAQAGGDPGDIMSVLARVFARTRPTDRGSASSILCASFRSAKRKDERPHAARLPPPPPPPPAEVRGGAQRARARPRSGRRAADRALSQEEYDPYNPYITMPTRVTPFTQTQMECIQFLTNGMAHASAPQQYNWAVGRSA